MLPMTNTALTQVKPEACQCGICHAAEARTHAHKDSKSLTIPMAATRHSVVCTRKANAFSQALLCIASAVACTSAQCMTPTIGMWAETLRLSVFRKPIQRGTDIFTITNTQAPVWSWAVLTTLLYSPTCITCWGTGVMLHHCAAVRGRHLTGLWLTYTPQQGIFKPLSALSLILHPHELEQPEFEALPAGTGIDMARMVVILFVHARMPWKVARSLSCPLQVHFRGGAHHVFRLLISIACIAPSSTRAGRCCRRLLGLQWHAWSHAPVTHCTVAEHSART